MIPSPRTIEAVERLTRQAEHGVFYGIETFSAMQYLSNCTMDVDWGKGLTTRLMFTRDSGHHTSGWFKNPDFERCYHLSISCWFWPAAGITAHGAMEVRDPEPGEVETFVDLIFGPWKRYIWEESPKSAEGKAARVHHYRVFCDPAWQPLMPRGEVYSREFTEKGWKSWSEQRSQPLNPEAAGTHTS